jgi:alanine-glyoxylate transaminase/serine-glyoxylate transaminase/serine-pyruvate transaminase
MKDRRLLMIPGPIEFEPEVLLAVGAPTASHLDPGFVETFGRAIERMRGVWQAPSGQPFVVAGSGTLAMELAGANLVEPGDRALVLSTGIFGDRFEELLSRHGAEVTALRAPAGAVIEAERVEDALRTGGFKLLTVTHVDTSTAVRMPLEVIGELGKRYGVLTIVDGVCSVGGEVIRQEEWGLDVVLTASQKAVGVPPGLALLVAGPRAMERFEARRMPVRSYYADWGKWLPIMRAYEERRGGYFGTPAVNLVAGLDVSLGQLLDEGMEVRWERHERLAHAFQSGLDALGLRQVPHDPACRAWTLTGCYVPDRDAAALVGAISRAGVIVAGGLHPEIRERYFRVGHMGAVRPADILATLGAIETGLCEVGATVDVGAGVITAQRLLVGSDN